MFINPASVENWFSCQTYGLYKTWKTERIPRNSESTIWIYHSEAGGGAKAIYHIYRLPQWKPWNIIIRRGKAYCREGSILNTVQPL